MLRFVLFLILFLPSISQAIEVEFGAAQQLTFADSLSFQLRSSDGPGNTRHLCWSDKRSETMEIFYGRLGDTSLNQEEVVRTGGLHVQNPDLAVHDDGTICVVWEEEVDGLFQVFASFSSNGSNWSVPSQISFESIDTNQPRVTAETGGGFGVVFSSFDLNDAEIMYSHSDGSTWSTPALVSNSPGMAAHPDCCTSDDVTHVVWQDNRDGNDEIYSTEISGGIISSPTRLSNDASFSWNPSIAARGDTIAVAFADKRSGDFEIHVIRQYDGIWQDDERITSATNDSNFPSIFPGTEQRWFVTWQDTRNGSLDIFFKFWGGAVWSDDYPVEVGENQAGSACGFANLDEITIVWSELIGSGNSELFCSDGNALPVASIDFDLYDEHRLVISPNPNTGIAFIDAVDLSVQEVVVLDTNGRQVGSSRIGRIWDGSGLPSGVYFLKTPTSPAATKFTISR